MKNLGFFKISPTFLMFVFLLQAQSKVKNFITQNQRSPLKLPLINARATSTGIVPIAWPLYAVDVDFADYSDLPDDDSGLHGPMGIALYTNESFFGGDCSNYYKYNCSQPNCMADPSKPRNASHPYINIQGYTAHSQLYVDYDFFSNSYMNMIYTENCSITHNFTSYNTTYGMMGLGLDGLGIHNFLGDYPTFSIDLDDTGLKGDLIFDCDDTKMEPNGYKQYALSSPNWEVTFESVSINGSKIDYTGGVIFDLNSPFIGIPENLYNQIITKLQQYNGLVCYNSELYSLGCVFSGDYEGLPDIEIDKKITISPQIYLHNIQNESYSLILTPLSLNGSDVLTTQVTSRYQDYIIVGAPFIKHYYICFESSPSYHRIAIHQKCSTKYEESNIMDYIYISICVLIPVILFCCFCMIAYIKNDKKNKKIAQEGQREQLQPFVLSFETSEHPSFVSSISDDRVLDSVKFSTMLEPNAEPKGTIFTALEKSKSPEKPQNEKGEFNVSIASSDSAAVN